MDRSRLKLLPTRFVTVVSLSILLGGLLAPAAAAGDRGGDIAIDALVAQFTQACENAGGQSTVHFDFESDGHLFSGIVTCNGQTGSWGPTWQCQAFSDGSYFCFLTRPEETIQQSVTVKPGTIVGALDETVPSSPFVLDQGGSGGIDGRVTARPGATPEPSPATTPSDEHKP